MLIRYYGRNPNVCATLGDRIFINIGCIEYCNTPGELAAVLSHELAHLIARHSSENLTSILCAIQIANLFGFKGDLGDHLPLSREHKYEADHIGLLIMAETGFDPQDALNSTAQRIKRQKALLNGEEPVPEPLSTHPIVGNHPLHKT